MPTERMSGVLYNIDEFVPRFFFPVLSVLHFTACNYPSSSITYKKSLKIPKGGSESVSRRRTENTTAKGKSTNGQTTIYKTYT